MNELEVIVKMRHFNLLTIICQCALPDFLVVCTEQRGQLSLVAHQPSQSLVLTLQQTVQGSILLGQILYIGRGERGAEKDHDRCS